MSTFNLCFYLETPASSPKIRSAIDALAAAFPEVPSIMGTSILASKDGALVMVPLPRSLSEQEQARVRSALNACLAQNGLSIR